MYEPQICRFLLWWWLLYFAKASVSIEWIVLSRVCTSGVGATGTRKRTPPQRIYPAANAVSMLLYTSSIPDVFAIFPSTLLLLVPCTNFVQLLYSRAFSVVKQHMPH